MPLDLNSRTWPKRDPALHGKPETGMLVGSAGRTFVNEGSVLVKAINFNGMAAPIPRESSMITSFALGEGFLYGATSGEQSWLFQYAYLSSCEAALPLGPIPDCRRVRNSLVVMPGHVVYGAGGDDGESHLFRVTGLGLPGNVIQEWGIPQPRFERLVAPVPGQHVVCLRLNRAGTLIYGLTEPDGSLFILNPEDNEVRVVEQVDPIRFFSPVLVEGPAGEWYAFGTTGRMMRYDPQTVTLEGTSVFVPSFPGRGPYARIAAATLDPGEGRLYVGDTEGLLSVIDLQEECVTSLGKPVALGGLDHLVRLRDGRIFGTAGTREGMAHLFVLDPRAGSLRDLGVLCATTEKAWYGYRFGAMVATPEGRVILGEDDHMGCLFSYFPPIPSDSAH